MMEMKPSCANQYQEDLVDPGDLVQSYLEDPDMDNDNQLFIFILHLLSVLAHPWVLEQILTDLCEPSPAHVLETSLQTKHC